MTVNCPHARLRLAASLAPTGDQQPTAYTISVLKRAVAAFDEGHQVAADHKAMLEIAREIVTRGPRPDRWARMARELVTVRKTTTFIGIDRASGPSLTAYWWHKGDMA